MKKGKKTMTKKRTAAAAALLVLLISGCARLPAPGTAPRLAAPDGGWVARTLKKMTVEEKTCQMATLYGYSRVLKDY